MCQEQKHVLYFRHLLVIMFLFYTSGCGIYLSQRTSIKTNVSFKKQLNHSYQKVNSAEDFVRTNNPYLIVNNTVDSNNGSLYDILPKEILLNSTKNQTAKHIVQFNGDGTQKNRVLNQSISDFRNHTLKYPYSPFRNRTFGAEELENEKFTGT